MQKQITRLATAAVLLQAVAATDVTLGQSFSNKSWNAGNTGREWLASGNWAPAGTPTTTDDLLIGTNTATFQDLVDFSHTSGTGATDKVFAHTVTFASDLLTQLGAHEAISNAANGKIRILSLVGAGTATSSASGVTVMSLASAAASTLYLGGTSAATGSLTIGLDYSGQSNWDVADTKSLVVTGAISGTGGIIKTGSGTLRLGKNGVTGQGGAHSFGGGFQMQAGTLEVGVTDTSSSLFGSGTLTLAGGAVNTVGTSATIPNPVLVTGSTSVQGVLFGGAATFDTSAAPTLSFTGSGVTSTFSGTVTVTGSQRVELFVNGPSGSTQSHLDLKGVITGSGGLVKSGDGYLRLGEVQGSDSAKYATSNYSGGFVLNAGTVEISANTNPFPTYPPSVVSGPFGTGTLVLNGGALTSTAESFTINNSVTLTGNTALVGAAGTAAGLLHNILLNGNMTVAAGTRTVSVGDDASHILVFGGNITQTGNATIDKTGPGVLQFRIRDSSTTKAFDQVKLSAGTVDLFCDNIFKTSAPVALNFNGGQLSYFVNGLAGDVTTDTWTAGSNAFGALSGSAGSIDLGRGKVLIFGAGFTGTATFTGAIGDHVYGTNTPTFGYGGLNKVGSGTEVFASSDGNFTYHGGTTVSAGTLVLQSALIPSGASVGTVGTTTVLGNGTLVVGGTTLGTGGYHVALAQNSIVLGSNGVSGSAVLRVADSRSVDTNSYNQSVIITSGVTIASTAISGTSTYVGQLDLTTNDMIVRGGNTSSTYGGLVQLLRSGLNGATLFTGAGITSSAAAADAAAGNLRYAVGAIPNSLSAGTVYSTFDGQTVNTTDVLVKYTYFGDADLSGVVDDTDFFLTNNGYLNSLSGWINGDFDYSGVVDDTDFFLLNNGYLKQGAAIGSSFAGGDEAWRSVIKPGSTFYDATVTFFHNGYWASNRFSDITGASTPGNNFGGRSVPEPSGSAVVALGLALLTRRRRR
jgi:fibronectin-binding autotransporter adhesin